MAVWGPGQGSARIPGPNQNHVNRDDMLDEATRRIVGSAGNYTVAIGGLPGIGKTTTGCVLAHRVGDRYPDGHFFARLDSHAWHGRQSDILRTFLLELGDYPEDIPDRFDARHNRWLDKTRGLRLLVFLDGAATASQIRLLQPAEGESLTLITEARRATDLSTGGVSVFELEPLDDHAARDLLSRIVGGDRIAAESAEVDGILALCGNVPFALSIVGSMIARSARLPLATTAKALRNESRRASELSLVAVFDAALHSLPDIARRCYRLLGYAAHTGIVSADMVAAVLDLPENDICDAMTELADLFLIVERPDGLWEASELTRVHARTIDDRPKEVRTAEVARLLHYYHKHVVAAIAWIAPVRPWRGLLYPTLKPSLELFEDAESAHEWLRGERGNILAAVVFAADHGEKDLVEQWSVLLWSFYEKDKYLDDLLIVHELGFKAVAKPARADAASLLHTQFAFRHYWLRDLDAAEVELRMALALAKSVKRKAVALQLEASPLEALGLVLLAQGRTDEAAVVLRRNHKLADKIGDPRRVALAMLHRSKAEEPDVALPLLERAMAKFGALPEDELENMAKVAAVCGRKLVDQGRFQPATEPLGWALSIMQQRRRWFDKAEIIVTLGDLAVGLGNHGQAGERYQEALSIYTELCFAEPIAMVRSKITALGQRD